METIEFKPLGIYQALANVMKDIGPVDKNGVCNAGGGKSWKFRSVYDVWNAVNPLLGQNGICIIPQVISLEKEPIASARSGAAGTHVYIRMRYRFAHVDGSFVDAEAYGEGSDYGDKAVGKAMTYACKQCLIQMFCIPTSDAEDPDEKAEPFVRESQQRRPPMPPRTFSAVADQEWQGRAPARVHGESWAAMMKLLHERHNGDGKAYLADLRGFLGADLKSINDVTEAEAKAFLEAQEEVQF